MDNPRPEKVAVVDEVRDRLAAADGAVLTEYRGLTVTQLAALRRGLTAAGVDYKIYKNTLVRLAVADSPQSGVLDLLAGPTAIAFVRGDVSAVAKALRDFSRDHPSLVIKGGMVDGGILTAADVNALAALPPRDTLLAQFAGALSAPLQQLAGLMQALPRSLAYGLAALVDQRREPGDGDGGTPETAGAPESDGAAGTEEATVAPPTVEAGDESPAGSEPNESAEAESAEAQAAEPEPADGVAEPEAGAEPATPEAGEQ
jgi:large subunit ribosomal protein L10